MKRLAKWLLGLVIILGIFIGAVLTLLSVLSFQLEPWSYPPPVAAADTAQAQPNILFLIAEDMSFRVGAFGDPVAVTPHLDQLAAEGVRYTNAFTTAGVCSPSRAALITGMHQISIGAQHMRTSNRPAGGYRTVPPSHVKAFPELLRAAGYYTFTTSKLDYQFSGAMVRSGPFTIWDAENDPQLWRGRQAEQPFFGMLNFQETHESGVFTRFGNFPHSLTHAMMQVMRRFFVHETDGQPVNPADLVLPPYYPDTPTVRSDIARHYANINAMDAVVGDVLDRLERDGLDESTIVVWTTDHGDGLPRAKRELFDSGIHVPVIIRWPEAFRPSDVEPGTLDERLISFVDFAPTFLTLAQAPRPDHLHGQDFSSTATRSYIYASRDRIDEVYDRQRAVRDTQFKYIRSWHPNQPGGHHLAFRDNLDMMRELWDLKATNQLTPEQRQWFVPPGAERLFDTQADPYELNDLSTDSSHLAVLERMRGELDTWVERVGDWSNLEENDLVEHFQPGGTVQKTATPTFSLEGTQMLITTADENASIGYRFNKGPWHLYSGPFTPPGNVNVTAKAVRYGWAESEPATIRWQ